MTRGEPWTIGWIEWIGRWFWSDGRWLRDHVQRSNEVRKGWPVPSGGWSSLKKTWENCVLFWTNNTSPSKNTLLLQTSPKISQDVSCGDVNMGPQWNFKVLTCFNHPRLRSIHSKPYPYRGLPQKAGNTWDPKILHSAIKNISGISSGNEQTLWGCDHVRGDSNYHRKRGSRVVTFEEMSTGLVMRQEYCLFNGSSLVDMTSK